MARRQQHTFHAERLCILGVAVLAVFLILVTLSMIAVKFAYYLAFRHLGWPPIYGCAIGIPTLALWAFLNTCNRLPIKRRAGETREAAIARESKLVIAFVAFIMIGSIGVQNQWLEAEFTIAKNFAHSLWQIIASDITQEEPASDRNAILVMESSADADDADDEIARKSLTAEQRAHLLYLSLDWQVLDSALQTNDFDTVDAQINHGDFSALSASIHSAFSARMDLSSGLTNHSQDLFDIYEERLASLSLSSVSYLQLYELWQETHELYEDDRCVRSARIYANACYWMQDYLSNLEQADSETLLYYLAEEISAYEKIYQHSNDFDVRKEIRGAYSRIASYQKIPERYRAYAKMIFNAI